MTLIDLGSLVQVQNPKGPEFNLSRCWYWNTEGQKKQRSPAHDTTTT